MTEEGRDAHLREALRHAPDAQLQPPPALSALILSEAHAKARDGMVPARSPRSAFAAVWSWLARPSVATGFAGVMVATLVGLMWWDQPMDEAQPRRPSPATTAAPAPVVIAPATPAPVASPTAPALPAADAEPAQPSRAERRKAAPAAEQSDKKSESARAAKPTVVPAAPPTESRAGPAQPIGEATASVAAQAAPAAVPAAMAAPAPARIAVDSAAVSGGTAKSKSADETKLTRSLAATDAVRSNAAGKLELNESRQRKEDEAARPTLARLRAAIAAEPARWAWQRSNGPAQDMNDVVYAWLAQLDSATGNTWQGRAVREKAASRELRLLRDGRVMHSLRLTDSGVLWDSASSSWQAELPAAAVQALQDTAP